MLGVVGSEPVVELPRRTGEPAAVHRADGDAVVQRAEQDEVLHDVRTRQHAVDPRVVQRGEQPVEHRPGDRPSPADRRRGRPCPRAVWSAATMNITPPRVSVSRRGRAASALAIAAGSCTRTSVSRRDVGVAEDHQDRSSSSPISASVGIASAHISRRGDDRSRRVGVCRRSLPDPSRTAEPWHERATERVAGPETAHDLHRLRGHHGRARPQSRRARLRRPSSRSPARSAVEQPAGRLLRIIGTDSDVALGAIAHRHRGRVERRRRSPGRLVSRGPERGPVVEVEHGVPRPRSRGEHARIVLRAGSHAIAEPATQNTATSRTTSSSTSPAVRCMSGAAGLR